MARTPETVNVNLHELMQLLNYRWAAVNSSEIGELGVQPHEALVADIDRQSKIEVRPEQLADLVHHMKEVCFSHEPPARQSFTIKNHNVIMRKLKSQAPALFKELPTGEVVMVDYEDRFA